MAQNHHQKKKQQQQQHKKLQAFYSDTSLSSLITLSSLSKEKSGSSRGFLSLRSELSPRGASTPPAAPQLTQSPLPVTCHWVS